eukprot:scaffold164133_cov35-Tisochrysis_lutea.AAC.1
MKPRCWPYCSLSNSNLDNALRDSRQGIQGQQSNSWHRLDGARSGVAVATCCGWRYLLSLFMRELLSTLEMISVYFVKTSENRLVTSADRGLFDASERMLEKKLSAISRTSRSLSETCGGKRLRPATMQALVRLRKSITSVLALISPEAPSEPADELREAIQAHVAPRSRWMRWTSPAEEFHASCSSAADASCRACTHASLFIRLRVEMQRERPEDGERRARRGRARREEGEERVGEGNE